MKVFEKNINYKGFSIHYKKDLSMWRAYSTKQLTFKGETITIKIDETGNTESEAIENAKVEINRQLSAIKKN